MLKKIFSYSLLCFLVSFVPAAVCFAKSDNLLNKQMHMSMQTINNDSKELEHFESKIKDYSRQLTQNTTLNINALVLIRKQLENQRIVLKKMQDRYLARLDKIKVVAEEYAKIKNVKLGNINTNTKDYEKYYQEKMQSFKKLISYIQSRLVQIRLMEYDINALLVRVKQKEVNIHNGAIWTPNTAFYKHNAMKHALDDLSTAAIKFHDQSIVGISNIFNKLKQASSLIGVIIYAFMLLLYFMYCWPNTLSKLYQKTGSARFFIHLINRGIIPTILCKIAQLGITTLSAPTPPMMFIGFINAFFSALCFVIMTVASTTVLINIFQSKIKDKHHKTPKFILLPILGASLIFLVNNISFVSLNTVSHAFLPIDAAALTTLFLSILLIILTLPLIKQLKCTRARKAS